MFFTMKNSTVIFLVLTLVYASHGIPTDDEYSPVFLQQHTQLDVFGNTRKLVVDLVGNLRKATDEARNAITGFSLGLQIEANEIREKIANDIKNFRERVNTGVEIMTNRFAGTGRGVRDCVTSHQNEISGLLNETAAKAVNCVTDRLRDANLQINGFTTILNGAVQSNNKTMEAMNNCNKDENVLTTGSCLGRVALNAEMQLASFTAQAAISMTRINLGIASFPSELEVCAGNRLMEASLASTKIVLQIGACSAGSVFSSFINSASQNTVPNIFSWF